MREGSCIMADWDYVIVGGGSVTQEYADEIGADGFAETGSGAVELVKSLMALKRGA